MIFLFLLLICSVGAMDKGHRGPHCKNQLPKPIKNASHYVRSIAQGPPILKPQNPESLTILATKSIAHYLSCNNRTLIKNYKDIPEDTDLVEASLSKLTSDILEPLTHIIQRQAALKIDESSGWLQICSDGIEVTCEHNPLGHNLKIFDQRGLKKIIPLEECWLQSIISHDNNYFCWSQHSRIHIFDNEKNSVHSWSFGSGELIAFDSTNNYILYEDYKKKCIQKVDIPTHTIEDTLIEIVISPMKYWYLPASNRIIKQETTQKCFRVYEFTQKNPLFSFKTHQKSFAAAIHSKKIDHELIAIASEEKITIYKVQKYGLIWLDEIPQKFVGRDDALQFDSSGKYLAYGTDKNNHTIYIYDIFKKQCIWSEAIPVESPIANIWWRENQLVVQDGKTQVYRSSLPLWWKVQKYLEKKSLLFSF